MGEYAPQDPAAYDPSTLKPKRPEGLVKQLTHFVFQKEYELEGYTEDRINLLLLGMGGLGHDGPFLTDTIIIASVKPSTGQIAMISIPRDLGVKIPKHGWYKINHASAFGEAEKRGSGGDLAAKVVEDMFDIDIHYYTRVDFQAFSEIVDEVGGIKVSVDRSFEDHMYPAPDHEFQTIEFSAGQQVMNGDIALKYVRSRHGSNGEGSDFARARRQQKVLFALKEKLLSFSTLANPVKINKIRKSLDQHVATNFEFADIMSLFRLSRELTNKKIITVVLDDGVNGYLKSDYTEQGGFMLRPKTGDFKEITRMIGNIFENEQPVPNDTPEQVKPKLTPATIEIQNGTWTAGMASRMRKRLQDKGFYITNVGNTEEKPVEQSGIYQLTGKDVFDVLQALQRELRVPIKQKVPEGINIVSSTVDILVLLGADINE